MESLDPANSQEGTLSPEEAEPGVSGVVSLILAQRSTCGGSQGTPAWSCLLQRRTWALTKGDFLPRVCGEQEYQQSQGRDEHTGDEQVETIVERPAAHSYCICDIWVWLFAAFIELLIPLARDSCMGCQRKETGHQKTQLPFVARCVLHRSTALKVGDWYLN